ncbi:anti-phage ZorAB system protein ZorA [Cupriavidus campinensis]|uniref:Anti-phage defense ZorAB system protein ZorA n=1 Tax=Cupriavidus campinensis TaxID=151783 RepID=A0AAE9I0N2_9BURK|nr:anti-phage ZorAB system protein ZorA [Cupriavidus campinensis]URF04111.1 anti-phage defense ZorAB system protein ZorA [Cupriavidus campinensis]
MGGVDLQGLARDYWHIGLVAVFLVIITIDFVVRFVGQSNKLSRELKQSLTALLAIRSNIKGDITELDEIGEKAMSGPALSHLWSEYRKTLHPQKRADEHGQILLVRWRSTALAESFFTEQAVVESRLKTEYFKHLPGILTGLGIIGTFLGLIKGLIHFDVSIDPAKAQEQLRGLVNSVGHAFFVSASAIGLAMLFTWIEKSLVTARCRQVEQLREVIDSLFQGGAGEEYLERLAISSENAATQSAQIKDALVADLKEILTTLATKQMEAQAQNVGQMSVDMGKVIAESLSGPMDAITKAVQGVSSNQGEAVNKMLTDVLASFASQMREMFGGQMAGMSELMVKASESMQATAIQFGQLAANMNAAGTNTVDAMGERLGKALEAMDARQAAMNAQMGAFVEQIKALVSESQTESSQKLKDTLTALGDQVAGVVEQLRKQAEQAAESQGERHMRFEQTTGQAIGSLSSQVEKLLAQSMETNKSLQNTVASLAQATDKAISGMNSGAETLYVAATDFAKAGQGVSETMQASVVATEAIKVASAQLTTSTDGARAIFADYAKTRDTFALMVAELERTFENAKRDASMTSEIIGRIETATQQLAIAQKQSEEYLQGVSEVLVKAHESFRENVERTLRDGNRQFQSELSSSVQLLSGAIKNLGDVVDDIPARR